MREASASNFKKGSGEVTNYISLGSSANPTLFLVHGFRGDHHGLLLIAEALEDKFYVIIPDLPGFGKTDPLSEKHTLNALGRWLKNFIKNTESTNKFGVVAHSFGSLVATNAVFQDLKPQFLVLINPISELALKGPKKMLTKAAELYYEAGKRLPEQASHRLLKNPLIVRFMSEIMAKTKDKELRSWIHGQHREFFSSFSDPESLLESYRASTSHTVSEFLKDFTKPTLLILGERDDISSLVSGLKLHKELKSSQFVMFEEAGHLIHYEQPRETAADIISFFDSEVVEKQ